MNSPNQKSLEGLSAYVLKIEILCQSWQQLHDVTWHIQYNVFIFWGLNLCASHRCRSKRRECEHHRSLIRKRFCWVACTQRTNEFDNHNNIWGEDSYNPLFCSQGVNGSGIWAHVHLECFHVWRRRCPFFDLCHNLSIKYLQEPKFECTMPTVQFGVVWVVASLDFPLRYQYAFFIISCDALNAFNVSLWRFLQCLGLQV